MAFAGPIPSRIFWYAVRHFLAAGLLPLLASGCSALRPSNSRDWAADQVLLPTAEVDGSQVTVRNIRNCDYRSADKYTVHYYDKTFCLDELNSVWFLVVPFAETSSLAHTMLSFGFADRDYLAVSVEIRKEKGEVFAPIKGMLRQFEIMYVLADERDVVALRTNHRLSEVYLYRVRATPEQSQKLFLDVAQRVNQLAERPEFYDTFANNCTTNIRRHVNNIAPERIRYDWRVLLTGYSDQLAYDLGLLDTDRSFEETKRRARINYASYAYRDNPLFSQMIRR